MKHFLKHLLIICSVLGFVVAGTNFYYALKYPLKFENIIINEASASQFDPDFICAVIAVESRFNKYALSNKGAMGLMQLMPATALQMANEVGIDLSNLNDLYNETINIRLGTAYLRYLKNKFFNIATVLAAYNAGETVVSSWLLDPNYSLDQTVLQTTPYKETNAYIQKVLETLKIYRNKRF
jgi:soluble lytic murein transglycosylase